MSVYGLKNSTHKMQYQHMNFVLAWRSDLNNRMQNPTDREQALRTIKEILGSESFNEWYREVHKLRTARRQQEYEQAISQKLEELTKKQDS